MYNRLALYLALKKKSYQYRSKTVSKERLPVTLKQAHCEFGDFVNRVLTISLRFASRTNGLRCFILLTDHGWSGVS